MKRFLMMTSTLIILITMGLIAKPTHATAARHVQTVTLYIHGHRGNRRSMQFLMSSAVFEEHAHTGVTALVSRKGHVRLQGHWAKNAERPLVNVVFKNNRTRSYAKVSRWLHNTLIALRRRYGVKRYNVVAHSLGNAAVLFYELKYSRRSQLPKLHKYVAIAGNFDGVPGRHKYQHPNRLLKNGRPKWLAPKYRYALKHRNRLHVRQARVLNIYGRLKLNGRHFDGRILNASSRSLGYLLRGKVASYRERRFVGPEAQHSRLRTNPRVARAVNRFIWR